MIRKCGWARRHPTATGIPSRAFNSLGANGATEGVGLCLQALAARARGHLGEVRMSGCARERAVALRPATDSGCRFLGTDTTGQIRGSLKQQFDERFPEGIALPTAAAVHGLPGWLRAEGWKVSFVWGARFEFLEYEAEWGIAGDQFHYRLWPHSRAEELDAMNEFVQPALEPDVASAIDAAGNYNRGDSGCTSSSRLMALGSDCQPGD